MWEDREVTEYERSHMANIFSGSEIVELGVQIEINGRDFYRILAEKYRDKKVREIFKFLEDAEEHHIGAFRNILESVEKYEPKEAYPEEYFAYMNSLAGDHVFTQKGERRGDRKSRKEPGARPGYRDKFRKGFYCILRRHEEGRSAGRLVRNREAHKGGGEASKTAKRSKREG
ncbi:MAG: ferritin family protein [Candidatus Omnitrophota bacterium]